MKKYEYLEIDYTAKGVVFLWHFTTRTYQSAVCVHSMMNTAMSILL